MDKELKNGDNDTKIKFIQEGANKDEAKIKIEGREDNFTGLTKEELMEYANDPFWVRLRWFLFILFWVIWIAMLVIAIILIIKAPRCASKASDNWVKDAAVYQIYPKSFKDSNGDGIGDVAGITSKIDYLSKLNVKNVLINSILETSPELQDLNLVNFTKINPQLGTNSDFDTLIAKMHEKGMKVLMELDIHHTSDLHPWFKLSQEGLTRHKNFYVWAEGNAGSPPTNDRSLWEGSTWTYSPPNRKYYLSHFSPSLPNLNLDDPILRDEIKDILNFWLQRNIDGFLFPNADLWFKFAPVNSNDTNFNAQNTTYEAYKTSEFIAFLKSAIEKANKNKRIMIVQPYFNDSSSLYATKADLVVNKAFNEIDSNCGTQCIVSQIEKVKRNAPENKETWMLGNKDISRITSRMGNANYLNALNALLLLLPGVSFPYYGDEIGMVDNSLTPTQTTIDPSCKRGDAPCKDLFRAPMQWRPQANAGFSNASSQTWTPVNQNFDRLNVESLQEANKFLPIFSQFMNLKSTDPFSGGHFKVIYNTPTILGFVRKCHDSPNNVVLLNLGKESGLFVHNNSTGLSTSAEIVLDTMNPDTLVTPQKPENVRKHDLNNPLVLAPGQVVILKLKE